MRTESQKESQRKWDARNRDRLRESRKEWRHRNPDKVKAYNQRPENKARQAAWARANVEKCRASVQRHREKYPERITEQHWRRKFGISRVWYEEHSVNGCEICGTKEGINGVRKNGTRNNLCIDHSHITDFPRGVLCHKCNSLIGLANDDADLLSKAISYLEKRKA
jgi:Recombination endonuclease VII